MRLPVTQRLGATASLLAGIGIPDRSADPAYALAELVRRHHSLPAHAAQLDLDTAWRVVRDVVAAVSMYADAWDHLDTEGRRDLVERTLWDLIETAGGVRALRTVVRTAISRHIGGTVGSILSWLVDRLAPRAALRALIRYTVELAVRETAAA